MKERFLRSATRMFTKEGRVTEAVWLTPEVLQIQLTGADLRGLDWSAGDIIKVQVADGAIRSYTPSRVDTAAGTMEMVVHVHDQSPGSQWGRALTRGDSVHFFGPSRSMVGPKGSTPWAAFYGDETAAGLAQAVVDALPGGTPVWGALELDAANAGLSAALSLPLAEVERGVEHGDALVAQLEGVDIPRGDGTVWLSGEAGSVLSLRTALLARGLRRSQLRIKPYWSTRGKAHRKQLERGALRA